MSPSRTEYAQGVPTWVDLGTPDPAKAAEFYGALFGWTLEDIEDPKAYGGYRNLLMDGAKVAGIGPLLAEGQPSAWTTYLAVDSASATAAAVERAGGTVLMGPMAIDPFGTMAIMTDPTGASFGIWQAGEHNGAERVNEHGAPAWNELLTRDLEAARDFYAQVFGYTYSRLEGETAPPESEYFMFEVDGSAVGGMTVLGAMHPPVTPPHWFTTFGHDDPDGAAERVGELGGSVPAPAFDATGIGRMAVLADPWGAVFAVIKLETPEP